MKTSQFLNLRDTIQIIARYIGKDDDLALYATQRAKANINEIIDELIPCDITIKNKNYEKC